MTPRRIVAAATLALAAWALAAASGPNRERVDPAALPGWLKEAAARPVPATSASTVWLHRESVVAPLPEAGVRVTLRWAAKVMTPEGLDAAKVCAVGYRSMDRVESLRAWTALADGSVYAPDPKQDVQDVPRVDGYEIGDDRRYRTTIAPRVAVGTIVACESIVVEGLDRGADDAFFGDDDEPTVYQRFALEVPAGWSKASIRRRGDGLEVVEGERTVEVVGRDLAPLPREDDRPPAHALLPHVWMRWWSPDGSRGFKDWDAVARWNEELTAPVLKERGGAEAVAARLRPKDPADLPEALGRMFEYASREIRYVAVELGIGGWKPHTPAFVVEKKFGDCKDKTFLMRAILEVWGFPSYMVDVRTRDLGPMEPDAPTFGQFDHAILAVPLPDGIGQDLWTVREVAGLGRVLFLDATASDSSPWSLREDVQGTRAVINRGDRAYLVDIPEAPPRAASVGRAIDVAVDDQGAMTRAGLAERWQGLAAARLRSALATLSDEERQRRWSELQQQRFPGAKVVRVSFEGLAAASDALGAETELAGGRFGRRLGDLLLVEPGRAARGVTELSLASPTRLYPLALPHAAEESVTIRVAPPPGWAPEALPPPFAVQGDLLAARASWSFSAGVLSYERTATLKVSSVPAERYAEFRTAVGRVRGADATGVVFVRTP